jgi:hypothetical protein
MASLYLSLSLSLSLSFFFFFFFFVLFFFFFFFFLFVLIKKFSRNYYWTHVASLPTIRTKPYYTTKKKKKKKMPIPDFFKCLECINKYQEICS